MAAEASRSEGLLGVPFISTLEIRDTENGIARKKRSQLGFVRVVG